MATTEVRCLSPLAGEGWGGGGSAKRAGRVDRLPPPAALWRAIALPSAIAEARLRRSYLRTAADGGLCSPASGRGEANPLAGRFNQRPSRSGLGNVPGNIGVAQAQGGLARLNGVWIGPARSRTPRQRRWYRGRQDRIRSIPSHRPRHRFRACPPLNRASGSRQPPPRGRHF